MSLELGARRPDRDWFLQAASGYVEALRRIDRAPLDTHALGVWSLRDLLGHTSRAFLTIETYLGAERAADSPRIDSPTGYYRAVIATQAADSAAGAAAIAKRGRKAGQELGDDPEAATREIAARVVALVQATSDDAEVATPWGWMRLGDYLGTRAFELTVHGMDVARATGIEIPDDLQACAVDAIDLAIAIASPEQLTQALLALTGREGLPHGFSIIP